MEELEGIELTEEEEAQRGIFAAAITAVLVGFISILTMGYRLLSSVVDNNQFGLFDIIDPILMFVFAALVYSKSRIAAVVLFAYFLVTRFHLILYIQSLRQLIVAAIILALFFYGIWGTFKYHSLEVKKNIVGGWREKRELRPFDLKLKPSHNRHMVAWTFTFADKLINRNIL